MGLLRWVVLSSRQPHGSCASQDNTSGIQRWTYWIIELIMSKCEGTLTVNCWALHYIWRKGNIFFKGNWCLSVQPPHWSLCKSLENNICCIRTHWVQVSIMLVPAAEEGNPCFSISPGFRIEPQIKSNQELYFEHLLCANTLEDTEATWAWTWDLTRYYLSISKDKTMRRSRIQDIVTAFNNSYQCSHKLKVFSMHVLLRVSFKCMDRI